MIVFLALFPWHSHAMKRLGGLEVYLIFCLQMSALGSGSSLKLLTTFNDIVTCSFGSYKSFSAFATSIAKTATNILDKLRDLAIIGAAQAKTCFKALRQVSEVFLHSVCQ